MASPLLGGLARLAGLLLRGGRLELLALQDAPPLPGIFLGRQNNVVKVDVSDEQNPVVVDEGTLGRDHPDHGQVTPFGNLLYIGNDHGTGSAFFCHQYGQDTIPLSADTVYPADGATSVSPDARITIVFSDFVDLETLSPETLAIRPVGGEALGGIFTYQFNHLSFSPDEPFSAETTYEVSIAAGGLSDVMGNGLAEDVVLHFSTGSMITVPPPAPPLTGTGGDGSLGTGGAPTDSGSESSSGGGFVAPPGEGPESSSGTDGPSKTGNSSSSSSDRGSCALVAPGQVRSNTFFTIGLLGVAIVFARRRGPRARAPGS